MKNSFKENNPNYQCFVSIFFQRVKAWGVLVLFQTTSIKDQFCKILKEVGAKVTNCKADNIKDSFVSE